MLNTKWTRAICTASLWCPDDATASFRLVIVLVMAVRAALAVASAVGRDIKSMFKKYLEKIFVAHLPLM